jgi:SAM-dependent methyltransferase
VPPVSTDDPRVGIQARLERASAYNNWIADQAKHHLGRRVLDLGCGAGNITELVIDGTRELVVGVDHWDEFVKLSSERLTGLGPNIHVEKADLGDPNLAGQLGHYGFDSAMCCNVMEHVEDHELALNSVAKLLPPGGKFFLLVPAFPVIYGQMDAADHHFRRYTKKMLTDVVSRTPFEIERQYYMNMPGFFSWLIVGRILRRSLVAEGAYSIYDKIIPLLRFLEGRIAPPFGQSLVAVLRVPDDV